MSIILDGTNGITSAGSVNVDELKDKDSTGAPDFPNGISAEYVIVDSGSAVSPSITFDGDTNTGMFRPAADTLAASTNGSERMRITSAGNVGIGTSSPDRALDVNGGIRGGVVSAEDFTAGPRKRIQSFSFGSIANGEKIISSCNSRNDDIFMLEVNLVCRFSGSPFRVRAKKVIVTFNATGASLVGSPETATIFERDGTGIDITVTDDGGDHFILEIENNSAAIDRCGIEIAQITGRSGTRTFGSFTKV